MAEDLNALIEEKINDTEFQNTLADLADEDKEKAISERKTEVLTEFASQGIKNKELAENYKVRAEKAEHDAKNARDALLAKGGESAPKPDSDLSSKDVFTLVEAKVAQEDVDEVIKAAKLLGKTIPEALQDETVKSILATRVEHRKSADATNVSASRRGTGKVSDEALLERFSKGEIPDAGTEESERLFFLRRKAK